jgi:hypothetical protein
MRIGFATFAVCASAIVVALLHEVIGPTIRFHEQIELALAIREIQRSAKPSLEIAPQFRVQPELREEKL